MKNYLSIARRWHNVKHAIIVEYERVRPFIHKYIDESVALSGQQIGDGTTKCTEKLDFYPFWGGFCFKFDRGWSAVPEFTHWDVSLAQAEEILKFLQDLSGEEEIRLLFRKWSEQ